jgi:hypothetical protein
LRRLESLLQARQDLLRYLQGRLHTLVQPG